MKVPFTNETKKFMHLGSVTIPPGETRHVDASLIPGEKPAAVEKEPPVPPDPIAELLKKKIADILPELEKLSAEALAHAGALEQDGQNRKTLVEAMAAEALRRAAGNPGS